MAWIKLNNGNNQFTLNPSLMCAGEKNFNPYIPEFLIKGLQPGKYKIQYISGAIRSHNKFRYNNYIPQFELKWNKYYKFQDYDIINFKEFNCNFFPELKFNALQCEYGTLPGFTTIGTYDKSLAQIFSKGENVPEDIYEYIYDDIKPLEFQLTRFSTISFWYTDNCAPCVEGSMTFGIYINTEVENMAANGISVVSFNIKNLKTKKPEYYNLQQKITADSKQLYKYQEILLEIQETNKYIQDLTLYNTLSYYKNTIENDGLYQIYNKDYTKDNIEHVYWKLTKINNNVLFNILTEIKNNKTIPLFKNIYTLIPSKSKELSGSIIFVDKYNDFNNKTYNLSGSEYVFSINQTTIIDFINVNAYLYVGKVTYEDLIKNKTKYTYQNNQDEAIITYTENLLNITLEENEQITEKLLIENKSLVNSDYYIYISYDKNDNNIISGIIKIITSVIQDTLNNNFYKLIGPFNNIDDAIIEIKKYCFTNGYQYEEIDNITYVFGKEEQ